MICRWWLSCIPASRQKIKPVSSTSCVCSGTTSWPESVTVRVLPPTSFVLWSTSTSAAQNFAPGWRGADRWRRFGFGGIWFCWASHRSAKDFDRRKRWDSEILEPRVECLDHWLVETLEIMFVTPSGGRRLYYVGSRFVALVQALL